MFGNRDGGFVETVLDSRPFRKLRLGQKKFRRFSSIRTLREKISIEITVAEQCVHILCEKNGRLAPFVAGGGNPLSQLLEE